MKNDYKFDILDWRIKHGFKQYELAAALDITTITLRKYETTKKLPIVIYYACIGWLVKYKFPSLFRDL